jgi:hypothetical protein
MADIARSDDDRVLDVGLVPPSQSFLALARARQTSAIAAAQKHDELLHARVRNVTQVRDNDDDPGADRDHVEHAAEVVGGGVVGALVVVVVEAA